MSRRSRRSSAGPENNRKKLALVGVLLVALVIAIATMPESETDEIVDVSASNVSAVSKTNSPTNVPSADSTSVQNSGILDQTVTKDSTSGFFAESSTAQRRSLEEIASQRPFRIPEDQQWTAPASSTVKIQAVYQAGGQAEALMEGNIVRPGTVLSRSHRIGQITINGVEVSPTDR